MRYAASLASPMDLIIPFLGSLGDHANSICGISWPVFVKAAACPCHLASLSTQQSCKLSQVKDDRSVGKNSILFSAATIGNVSEQARRWLTQHSCPSSDVHVA